MVTPSTPRIVRGRRRIGVALAVLLTAVAAPVAAHHPAGSFGLAVSAESLPGTSPDLNTPANDGCPIESPDGLRLYTATNRPDETGSVDLDIWVAARPNTHAPYGAPVKLPASVNSDAADFCPTPIIGGGLFFVSNRVIPGVAPCGGATDGGDIYFTRYRLFGGGWTEPVHLGCQVNSVLGEAGPSYFFAAGRFRLYFSSGPDIYESVQSWNGSFAPATPVAELNDPAAGDFRPNVRANGLEVVFDSNRGGATHQDIYIATRARTTDPWSTPVNLGPNINTGAMETRASFSLFGNRLYFGRTPGPDGGTDIFVSTR
jgi:hypothetical protein